LNDSWLARRRLDAYTLEMIFVVALITLHDFLLSDALSLPLALQRSTLAELRSLDRVISSLEFLVPIVIFAVMLILWMVGRDAWVHHIAVVFLIWVTLRLVAKVGLVLFSILSRPVRAVSGLLIDTIVLWFVIFLIFGVWYWIIDGGGPRVRREGIVQRFDFGFPQRLTSYLGWQAWQPGFWDYVFLGFSASTQFGAGDVNVFSVRAKFLLMIQVTLSIAVIVFIASIAIGSMR
jgi:hypothetical protein